MSTNEHKPQPVGHSRRESELSAPVSDYEYYQFSPTTARPPPTPATPAAPPLYTGTQSPVMPPQGSMNSDGGLLVEPDHSAKYPEVVPEGHQITPKAPEYQRTPDHGEKEAYVAPKSYHQAKVEAVPPSPFQEPREDPNATIGDRPRRYPFGWSKKRFFVFLIVLIVAIVVIAVGVGVGVGVGTSKHHNSSTRTGKDPLYAVGGAYDTSYYSKKGAFNGSGVALADVNFGLDNSIYVFYQKFSGEIEQLIYESDGSWNFVTQVASNAKNSTPLSTVAYIVNGVATWHLFYISKDNLLRQRVQTNSSQFQTNIWEDGPINKLNLQVYNGDTVGMQACYWGNYYGSLSNYNDAAFLPSNRTATIGMNIWYADTATSFQQYDWTNGQAQWNHTRTWPNMNGHAGVGCQSWLSNTTSYVFMVDTSNNLNIYWKDINTNITTNDDHPINTYTRANGINIPNVHPSTSLGYTDFMIYQTLDGAIHGVNVTWAAEDTTIAPAKQSTSHAAESVQGNVDGWALQPQDAGIGGTHMAITGSTPASGGRQELLFYQAKGDDLRLGKRDAAGGDFSFINVPLDTIKG